MPGAAGEDLGPVRGMLGDVTQLQHALKEGEGS